MIYDSRIEKEYSKIFQEVGRQEEGKEGMGQRMGKKRKRKE